VAGIPCKNEEMHAREALLTNSERYSEYQEYKRHYYVLYCVQFSILNIPKNFSSLVSLLFFLTSRLGISHGLKLQGSSRERQWYLRISSSHRSNYSILHKWMTSVSQESNNRRQQTAGYKHSNFLEYSVSSSSQVILCLRSF
jgi:hypothetical protein